MKRMIIGLTCVIGVLLTGTLGRGKLRDQVAVGPVGPQPYHP